MRKFKLLAVALVLVLTSISVAPAFAAPAAITLPDPAMESVWNRTDQPVASLSVSRTWIWGPSAFDTRQEQYAESPNDQRLVAYFDKSRMEITNPSADRNSQWFVTNGLLAKELVSGQMQLGDAQFENRWPAEIPVAGDPDDVNGPTYATYSKLLGPADRSVSAVMATVDRNGNVSQNGALGNYTDYVYFVPETGHNIPRVFWDFLNSSGTVSQNNRNVQGKLFDPTFFATGFPITEAYWGQVKVAGQQKWVLTQVFERRVLTYTPENPQGWQVEMGNIGRHYFDWRYNNAGQPAAPAPAPAPVSTLPEGWTLLDDSATGYKMGVPAGWTGMKAGSPEMQQYLDEVRQVDPQTAQNMEELIAAGFVKALGFDAAANPTSGFVTNFNVVKEALPQPMSLDEYVAASVTGVEQALGVPAGSIQQQKVNTATGELAMIKYTIQPEGAPIGLTFVQFVGVTGTDGYVLTITTTTDQEAAYATVISQLGQYFEIAH